MQLKKRNLKILYYIKLLKLAFNECNFIYKFINYKVQFDIKYQQVLNNNKIHS